MAGWVAWETAGSSRARSRESRPGSREPLRFPGRSEKGSTQRGVFPPDERHANPHPNFDGRPNALSACASGFRLMPTSVCRKTCASGFRLMPTSACRKTCASGFRNAFHLRARRRPACNAAACNLARNRPGVDLQGRSVHRTGRSSEAAGRGVRSLHGPGRGRDRLAQPLPRPPRLDRRQAARHLGPEPAHPPPPGIRGRTPQGTRRVRAAEQRRHPPQRPGLPRHGHGPRGRHQPPPRTGAAAGARRDDRLGQRADRTRRAGRDRADVAVPDPAGAAGDAVRGGPDHARAHDPARPALPLPQPPPRAAADQRRRRHRRFTGLLAQSRAGARLHYARKAHAQGARRGDRALREARAR